MLLFRVFLNRWAGSSATTGAGTITTSQKVGMKSSSATTGAGNIFTLGKVGNKPNPGGQLTGFGLIITAGKRNLHAATATVGAGAITTSGVRKRQGASATVGVGTITTAGKNPHLTYYHVRLTATNSMGSDTKTRTEYVTVNRLITGQVALVGTGLITTIANAPANRTWSVRLTATNSSGSDTKTRTAYITVFQPAPSASLVGLGSIFTAGKPRKYAATSLVGAGLITTRVFLTGVSAVTGAGTITTGPARVGVKAVGGWGADWGGVWGGGAGVAINGVGVITTAASGHGTAQGASATVGAGLITTLAKVGAKAASSTVGAGTITTTPRYLRHGSAALVGVATILTRGGTSALNETHTLGTGLITTRGKLGAKAAAHLLGHGQITTVFFGVLPDLTEFTVPDLDLTESSSGGRVLTAVGVSGIDLTEDEAI